MNLRGTFRHGSVYHYRWCALSLLIVLIDQWTKAWAVSDLGLQRAITLLPVLEFRLAINPGAAFSFLAVAGGWQHWFFVGIALLASLAILISLYTIARERVVFSIGLCCILGGAIGNVIDRFYRGVVIDFIHLHYQQYSWPIFNVADMAICLGALLVILRSTNDA